MLDRYIGTCGAGDREEGRYGAIEFLERQVSMGRPERCGRYKQDDLPHITSDHRARANYKDCQRAPGDYEAIISQRPIAIHALEHPTKFDAGVYMFRKMLRDAIRGANPAASPERFGQWMREFGGQPNSYCSGNVFHLPLASRVEDEVAQRRMLCKQLIAILTESDTLQGPARATFVKERFEALEQEVKKTFPQSHE